MTTPTSRGSQRRESVRLAVGQQWPGVAALGVGPNQMRLLVVIYFWALSSLAADDLSRDWKRHLGVEEEFTNSKCVFVGKVISTRQIVDKDGFIQGTFYVVRVSGLLRGNPLKEVEIYDENSSGRFPMRVGRRYLLFAYEATFEGVEGLRLTISSCGNSGTLEQAKKELAMVRKLKKSQPSGAGNSSHASQLNVYENSIITVTGHARLRGRA